MVGLGAREAADVGTVLSPVGLGGFDGIEGSPDGTAMPVVGLAVTEKSASAEDEAGAEAEAEGTWLPLEPPAITGGPGIS